MPKKQRASGPVVQPSSGATGGPATARGVDYQLDYALYHALDLIGETLSAPYKDLSITIEPRQLHGATATRSDVRITSTRAAAEVKLHPDKQDIIDWIDRVASDPSPEKHTLVYNAATGPLLVNLAELIRLAKEAGSETSRLRELAAYERVKDVESILGPLGEAAAEKLQRTTLQNIPEAVLQENIAIRARVLAPSHAERLKNELKIKLLQGMKARATLHIRELLEYIRTQEISLTAPKTLTLAELDQPARNVLAALQHCTGGLPNPIIASIAHCAPTETTTVLRSLLDHHTLHYEAERWRMLTTLPTIEALDGTLASALAATTDFIKKHEDTVEARGLLPSAVALTRACAEQDPKAITPVFRQLEKLLKRTGEKYLVLELAELVIKAAAREPRSLNDARARAHALICGTSWVYQRTGDLATARALARQSLELGKDLNYERNTAFCFKCEGRILRLEAERTSDHQDALLTASAESITTAIDHFSKMPDIGPTHQEVGDCFSLLARTYLVARDYERARKALQKAYELIPQNGSKDHLDLLILTGDLHAAKNQPAAAEQAYTEALVLPDTDDVQVSEIFARGYFQRAKTRENLKRTIQAVEDYQYAATLWKALHEYEQSAKATWKQLYL